MQFWPCTKQISINIIFTEHKNHNITVLLGHLIKWRKLSQSPFVRQLNSESFSGFAFYHPF